MFVKLIFVILCLKSTLGGSPSSPATCIKYREYLKDDAPAREGILAGTYASGSPAYVALGYYFDLLYAEIYQQTAIVIGSPSRIKIPGQEIVVTSQTVSYLVPDVSCNCRFIPSSSGRSEVGVVKVDQSGYGSEWYNYYGALFNGDGSLRCVGPVSIANQMIVCIAESGIILRTSNYHVLVCNPK